MNDWTNFEFITEDDEKARPTPGPEALGWEFVVFELDEET
jgi:hypothetical protein